MCLRHHTNRSHAPLITECYIMLSMNIHFDNQRIITTIVHIGRFDERIKTREMKVHEKRNDISLLLSLLLLLVIVHCNEASYDCNVGCDLDPVVNGDTVCGDDGAIYPNECFAICQGVKVSENDSRCPTMNSGGRLAKTNAATELTGFVSIAVMTRYKSEGFKFVRKFNYALLDGEVKTPSYNLQDLGTTTSNVSPSETFMITSEGYEYTSTHYNFNSRLLRRNEIPRSTDSYNPNQNNHNRTLKVVGTDTRLRIPDTTIVPYKFIGALGYNPDNIICSGTVISKTAILTAAHCIFDAEKFEWVRHTYFAPARYVGNGKVNDPFGRWDVENIIFLRAYAQTGLPGFDFAVVTYQSKNISGYNYTIGEYVGHAGLAEVSGFDDPILDNSTITGYPGDRTGGRAMWTMGQCESGFFNASDYWLKTYGATEPEWDPIRVGFYDCDITGGTSGSSILGSDNKARGVNTFELTDPTIPINGGNVFIQGNGMYDLIANWSGNSNATTGSSAPIPIPSSRSTLLPTKVPTRTPSLSSRPSPLPSAAPVTLVMPSRPNPLLIAVPVPITTPSLSSQPSPLPTTVPVPITTPILPSRPNPLPVAVPVPTTTSILSSRPNPLPIAAPVPKTTPLLPSRPSPLPIAAPLPEPVPEAAPVKAPHSVSAPTPVSVTLPTGPVPTPVPASVTPPDVLCFSNNNIVQVKDVGSIMISDLTIGDYVLGGNGLFTKVYGFGHFNHEVESEFYQIFFENMLDKNAERDFPPLEISSKHLVFVERKKEVVVVPSSDVIVGDVMSRGGKRIKSIRQVNRHGVYAPLTLSGDIVVSDILASNHVQLLNNPLIIGNQHRLGELVWMPRRLFCQLFMHVCKKETYTTEGYSTWAYWIVWFGSVINQYGWMGALIFNVLSTPFILIMSMI